MVYKTNLMQCAHNRVYIAFSDATQHMKRNLLRLGLKPVYYSIFWDGFNKSRIQTKQSFELNVSEIAIGCSIRMICNEQKYSWDERFNLRKYLNPSKREHLNAFFVSSHSRN